MTHCIRPWCDGESVVLETEIGGFHVVDSDSKVFMCKRCGERWTSRLISRGQGSTNGTYEGGS